VHAGWPHGHGPVISDPVNLQAAEQKASPEPAPTSHWHPRPAHFSVVMPASMPRNQRIHREGRGIGPGMTSFETIVPIVSIVIAFATVVVTALLMARQAREMAHERNAIAILESIDRLTRPELVKAFEQLATADERYATDDDLMARYPGSADDRANYVVGQLMETVACLARREVLDPSLIVDAVGYMIRHRWAEIESFVLRRRRIEKNDFIYENFEWFAKYSTWWKDVPRPNDPNYSPDQFK